MPALVETVTRLKTGSLCRFAAELGATAARAMPDACSAIGTFAERMGCASQMLDDLGALTSPARRAKAYEDLRDARPTWPWAWLAETAAWDACIAATDLDERAALLAAATQELGRARIRATLDAALRELRAKFGQSAVIDRLADELALMETRYG